MEYNGCKINIKRLKDGAESGRYVWENETLVEESAETFSTAKDAEEDAKEYVDQTPLPD